jgi:multiple sugar transport system permease protein
MTFPSRWVGEHQEYALGVAIGSARHRADRQRALADPRDAGFNLAFAVWLMNGYFSSIPVELEEAAMVDGASKLGALARITLPLAIPGIVTALIFTFIGAWNEFLVALTLTLGTSHGQQPLTVGINSYIGQYSIDWGHLFAGAVIATVPVIVLFAFIEGRVVSGLTAGSIK